MPLKHLQYDGSSGARAGKARRVCALPSCPSNQGKEPSCPSNQGNEAPAGKIWVCPPCKNRIRTDLADLPKLYLDCENELAGAYRPLGVKVSGGLKTSLSLREAAVSARTDILTLLASWSGLVVAERRVVPPAYRTPKNLSAFLEYHLDWLFEHRAVPEFGDELLEVAGVARRAAGPQPQLHIDLGFCIKSDCGSPMVATTAVADDSRSGRVQCEAGHFWLPHEWLLIAHRKRQARSDQNS